MSHWPVLAERKLLVEEDEVEGRRETALRIGHPYWIDDGRHAACLVAVEGIRDDLPPIRGVDFVQALQLAIALGEQLLTSPPRGVRLFWPDGTPYAGIGASGEER